MEVERRICEVAEDVIKKMKEKVLDQIKAYIEDIDLYNDILRNIHKYNIKLGMLGEYSFYEGVKILKSREGISRITLVDPTQRSKYVDIIVDLEPTDTEETIVEKIKDAIKKEIRSVEDRLAESVFDQVYKVLKAQEVFEKVCKIR